MECFLCLFLPYLVIFMERSQIGHVDVVDDQGGNGDHLAGPSGHDGKEHEHHHEDDPKGAEKRLRHDGVDHPRAYKT